MIDTGDEHGIKQAFSIQRLIRLICSVTLSLVLSPVKKQNQVERIKEAEHFPAAYTISGNPFFSKGIFSIRGVCMMLSVACLIVPIFQHFMIKFVSSLCLPLGERIKINCFG